jgi:alpha-L-fucosidase
MRFRIFGRVLAALATLSLASAGPAAADQGPDPQALQNWRDMRFGMFIHWGPVSLKGTEIGWSRGAQIPIEEYDQLYKQFNPTNFNADQWVRIAKDAGMKYMVLVTKHHDGFCMWDTKQTDYNIMNSPYKHDVVKELSAACRRAGLKFGTYYSVCDWHHPAFPRGSPGGSSKKPNPDLEAYTQYVENQVAELIRGAGPLLTLWYDVPQDFDRARGERLIAHTRGLQPDILINNRTGAPGDYDTPEQTVGGFNMDRPWETCMTICNQWAWKPNDPMKSLKQCLHVLVKTAGGDGNLLFNVGPTPDGIIETRQVERLREMGDWLKTRGESIYGTRGGPYKPSGSLVSTRKGNRVYVHLLNGQTEVTLPPLEKKVTKASVLGGGKAEIREGAEGWQLSVDPAAVDEIDTVVVLELDGSAMELAPRSAGAPTGQAKASNVFQNDANYNPEYAVDGDESTRWATDAGLKACWIEVELPKEKSVSKVLIDEWAPRIQKYELQVKKGDAWETFHAGTTVGQNAAVEFAAVTGKAFRLNILDATDGPTINEIRFQ